MQGGGRAEAHARTYTHTHRGREGERGRNCHGRPAALLGLLWSHCDVNPFSPAAWSRTSKAETCDPVPDPIAGSLTPASDAVDRFVRNVASCRASGGKRRETGKGKPPILLFFFFRFAASRLTHQPGAGMPAYRRSTVDWPSSATRCTGIMLLLLLCWGRCCLLVRPIGGVATALRFRVRTVCAALYSRTRRGGEKQPVRGPSGARVCPSYRRRDVWCTGVYGVCRLLRRGGRPGAGP